MANLSSWCMLLYILFSTVLYCRAQVTIITPPENTTVCKGHNVTISCGYQSPVVLTLRWIINNVEISGTDIMNSDVYELNEGMMPNATSLTVLSINDSTTIQCVIPLSTEVFSWVGTVTVVGPSTAPMDIIIPPDDITSESFIIQWQAVVDILTVNYTVRWYIGDNEIGMASVNETSYTVSKLIANTSYIVTVVANNTCGALPVSNNVTVTTKVISSTSTGIVATPTITPTATTTPTTTSIGNGGSDSVSNPTALYNGVIIATACMITFIMTLIAV